MSDPKYRGHLDTAQPGGGWPLSPVFLTWPCGFLFLESSPPSASKCQHFLECTEGNTEAQKFSNGLRPHSCQRQRPQRSVSFSGSLQFPWVCSVQADVSAEAEVREGGALKRASGGFSEPRLVVRLCLPLAPSSLMARWVPALTSHLLCTELPPGPWMHLSASHLPAPA